MLIHIHVHEMNVRDKLQPIIELLISKKCECVTVSAEESSVRSGLHSSVGNCG